MNFVAIVCNRYVNEFKQSRGQHIFFGLTALVVGVVLPLLYEDVRVWMMAVLLVGILYPNQTIAKLFIVEKEQKTMESLLSTPLSLKHLLFGSFKCYAYITFIFVFCIVALQFMMTIVFAMKIDLQLIDGILLLCVLVVSICYILSSGLLISLVSDNLIIASKRLSARANLCLLYVGVSVACFVYGHTLLFYCLLLPYIVYTLRMLYRNLMEKPKQLSYEQILREQEIATVASKQFAFPVFLSGLLRTMFVHEWKYAKTFRLLSNHILLMPLYPALLLLSLREVDFALPMLAMILLSIRIPLNLVSISIGGEKAYKTFESLLSTPVSTPIMFVGKMLPSIFVSMGIIIASVILMILAATMLSGHVVMLTASQWMLGVVDGVLLTTLMIFITGFLALMSKTPRIGLWIGVIASFFLILPHFLILYVVEQPWLYALGYGAILLAMNVVCFTIVIKKIDRSILLSRI